MFSIPWYIVSLVVLVANPFSYITLILIQYTHDMQYMVSSMYKKYAHSCLIYFHNKFPQNKIVEW